MPFQIWPIGSGRVISIAKDADDIESDLQQFRTLRPTTAEYLRCAAFVGEAFDLVFNPWPPTDFSAKGD